MEKVLVSAALSRREVRSSGVLAGKTVTFRAGLSKTRALILGSIGGDNKLVAMVHSIYFELGRIVVITRGACEEFIAALPVEVQERVIAPLNN